MKNNTKVTVKRRLNVHKIIRVVFFIFAALYLVSSIGLKSHNVSLTADIRKVNAEIVQLESEIDTINTQIADLEEKNRVMSMVDDSMSSSNVRTVVDLSGNR